MSLQVQFIDGPRMMNVQSIEQWVRAGGFQIPDRQNPSTQDAINRILSKDRKYGFLQQAEFVRELGWIRDYGFITSAGYPPNPLSVVDAHLPNVPDWILARNPLKPAFPNFANAFADGSDYPKSKTEPEKTFIFFKYMVAGSEVFVVWPYLYKDHPPKPNRLGWLPQMEFAIGPANTSPRVDALTRQVRFTYASKEGLVNLVFPPDQAKEERGEKKDDGKR